MHPLSILILSICCPVCKLVALFSHCLPQTLHYTHSMLRNFSLPLGTLMWNWIFYKPNYRFIMSRSKENSGKWYLPSSSNEHWRAVYLTTEVPIHPIWYHLFSSCSSWTSSWQSSDPISIPSRHHLHFYHIRCHLLWTKNCGWILWYPDLAYNL